MIRQKVIHRGARRASKLATVRESFRAARHLPVNGRRIAALAAEAEPRLQPRKTRVRRTTEILLVMMLVSAPLVAQGASPYVPLHHWAMPYVEHLIARGVLADPAPLSRPLHADDLVRALEAADTTRLNTAERRIVRDILADLRPPQTDPPWLRRNGELTAAG